MPGTRRALTRLVISPPCVASIEWRNRPSATSPTQTCGVDARGGAGRSSRKIRPASTRLLIGSEFEPFWCVFILVCSFDFGLRVSLGMMGASMKWGGDEQNIRSYNGGLARLDGDFCPVVTPTEPNQAFGHFQPRGVIVSNETERSANDNGLRFRRRADEKAPGPVLFDRRLHRAALQPHSPSALVRLIQGNCVAAELELRTIAEL